MIPSISRDPSLTSDLLMKRLLCTLAWLLLTTRGFAAEKPNILLNLTDDLGCYGAALKAGAASALPRARIGPPLQVEGQQRVLECSGSDPGLAADRFAEPLTGGPFKLSFRVQSGASGEGEVYPYGGAGEIRIEGLQLTDSAGEVLQHWP